VFNNVPILVQHAQLKKIQCNSCIYGFTLNTGTLQSCNSNVESCNSLNNCEYCGLGYVLVTNNSEIGINQTCLACNTSCARCMPNNTNICTACLNGFYLFNNACIVCASGCSSCLYHELCYSCNIGYTIIQNSNLQPLSYNLFSSFCVPCESPCMSCYSSASICLSCIDRYYLNGTKCISIFNFEITIIFNINTTIQTFNT